MKNIEWKKYLIELVVVFISITAAFLLNSWRENSISKELEEKYLNSLKNDAVQDSISLDYIIKLNNKKLERFENYVSENSKMKQPVDSALILFKDILSISDFSPKTNTYESMKYSGNLNFINSYNLREQITNYYESFGDIKFQQNLTLEFINSFATKFVIENLNVLEFRLVNNKVVRKSEIDNLIFTYYVFLIQNIKFQKEVMVNNKKLLHQLNL